MLRAISILLVLAGCTSDPIYLRHHDGRVAKCGPFPTTDYISASMAPHREAQCIYDFQRQGFERDASR